LGDLASVDVDDESNTAEFVGDETIGGVVFDQVIGDMILAGVDELGGDLAIAI
jgi:hypothetical protein